MSPKIIDTVQSFFSSLSKTDADKQDQSDMMAPYKLDRPFTLTDEIDPEDPLFKEIVEQDLKKNDSPLKLMKHYADVLNKEKKHGKTGKKLDLLFRNGITPDSMKGFYHGITLSLRTGIDTYRLLDGVRQKLNLGDEVDPLQLFYGRLLSSASPWAGKDFKRIEPEKLDLLTNGLGQSDGPSFLGINSFRKEKNRFLNNLSAKVLSLIIDMEAVPGPENRHRSWIYAKGGLFIAGRQKTVDVKYPEKKVMALNYRWKNLGNRFPNRLLIDELVQIAEGLFLGKLYYATALEHILKDYHSRIPVLDYKYRNFGYFLLMDDSWLHEKNMLFPDLTYEMADNLPEKFGTFHLIDSPESIEIKGRLAKGKTVLHYLQELSRGVEKGKTSEKKYFKEIHNLFMCGRRPDGIEGFFHGGVVAFKSSGFLKKFKQNLLNDLWPAVRPFSPWTGKTFHLTTIEKIEEYIGKDAEHYKNTDPVILGTNTYRKELGLSLPATLFIEHLRKIGMVVEYPDKREKEQDIYVKSFYFIAANNRSVSPSCQGKKVLQFNYRWPGFHTMPPDHLCIDELVRIADGLYLGQLLYSTDPKIEYSPDVQPEIYKYENFGYFLLMDDEWHTIREFIQFDTDK